MSEFAAFERRLRALEKNRGAILRWCEVVAVDEAAGSARVRIPDADDMVTMPLRVLQQRTLKDQHQEMPDIGEHVAVLFAGQGFEQGVILGAIYGKAPSPGRPAHVWYRKFEDGTQLEYDRAEHVLRADVKGRAEINTELDIKADAGTSIDATAGISIKATAGTMIDATAGTTIDATAAAAATVTAPLIALRGAVTIVPIPGGGGSTSAVIDGNLKINGNLTVNGDSSTSGNINAGGQIIDAGGNTNHHSHSSG